MTNKLVIIQKGESLPFKFDRGGATIVDWVCVIKVKQKPGDTPIIDRVIPPDQNERSWSDFLKMSETNLLVEGLWYITGILTNMVDDEQEEIPVRFQVTKTWSTP